MMVILYFIRIERARLYVMFTRVSSKIQDNVELDFELEGGVKKKKLRMHREFRGPINSTLTIIALSLYHRLIKSQYHHLSSPD
jgi:hypothetical protein